MPVVSIRGEKLHKPKSWGGLQDQLVEIDALVPPFKGLSPAEIASLARRPLVPLEVEGDRQYIISLRQGILTEPHMLKQLLSGEPLVASQ